MKKCLITGAAGQIGIKLLNELIKSQKYEITAVDLKSNKSLKRFANYETKVNILYADVNDKSIIKQLIKEMKKTNPFVESNIFRSVEKTVQDKPVSR